MQVLRADTYRSMPWKNGGGLTTEIVVSPAGAGLDDFDWRLSMAKVESGGPFSSFAGIDRTLSVLEGEGISLSIEGKAPAKLVRASPPLPFPADVSTDAELIDGPVVDLNVMSRRGRCGHSVERIELFGAMNIDPRARTVLLFSLQGGVEVHASAHFELRPRDTVILTAADAPVRLESRQASTLFVIRIHEISGDR
jgi:environmental stress-induced protein Ves